MPGWRSQPLPPSSGPLRPSGRPAFAFALAFALVALAALAPAGHAAIRLDEVNLGCSSSRAVSWIDLSGADGDVMDRNAGLSALDHNGQPLWDIPGVFGSLAGVAWISGRRFLVGTGNLVTYIPELPGINAGMPAPLDSLGGTLTYYRRNANGTLTVLDQLRYGGPGQPAAPPAGTSLKRAGGWVWNLDPQAQNFFNDWTATDPACFAYPRFFVSQLLVTCSGGGTSDQYVQLGSNSAAPFLDPLLHLRLYGAGGALLADVAQPFGAAAGGSLGTWLLGGPAFAPAPGAGADGAFPVALDPAGGRIELVAELAGVPPVFEDSLAYGPSRPPPTDGLAFQRLAAFGAPTTIEPQPRNSAGQAVQIPGCAYVPPPPRYYLREVALQCEDGGTLGQFVEIAWDHLADPLDARYHLRAFDRVGTQQFDIQRVLGWRTAGYMSVAGQFLVQSADYPLPPHLSPDGLLPAPLDTLAGRLELVFAGPIGDSVVSTLAWGAAPLARPIPGTSLASDGVHVAPAAEPNPVNYDGRSLRLVGCHFGGPPHGFVVGELVADCADGSPDGLFVELQSTAANEYRDPTLGLRVVPAAGAAVTAFPLFPVGQPSWPAGSRWLVGGSGFAARSGLAPDAALSAAVEAADGRVEIFHRNPVTLADSVLATLPLAGVPLRAGHAYVRGPGGQYAITLPAMPQRFDGTQVAPPGCYAVPRGDAVAMAELMLRCRDGDAGGQFVRLVATDPDAVY
ncbi:MAG TPA: hypothetical protein VGU27_12090, partial [Candidatus Eisenbacteria bacterium]|nr:hypothetical protein [Candidatus Eisenbacteria bacterium]